MKENLAAEFFENQKIKTKIYCFALLIVILEDFKTNPSSLV
jgi:hypothetical protein